MKPYIKSIHTFISESIKEYKNHTSLSIQYQDGLDEESIKAYTRYKDIEDFIANCKTKDAKLTIGKSKYNSKNLYIVWEEGTFISGNLLIVDEWIAGDFIDGVILNEDGLVWNNGVFHNGTAHFIDWRDGVWKNGVFQSGSWADGVWENGVFLGEWAKGKWKDGIFMGDWYGGYWDKGQWGGYDDDSGYDYDEPRWKTGKILVGGKYIVSKKPPTSSR